VNDVIPTHAPYPIGTPGLPWGDAEVATWRSRQTIKRSYEADVLRVIETRSSPLIHRWNMHAVDPNRSFRADSPAQESAALMRLLAPFLDSVLVHIDLHETTDTDESEFRPALAARDGVAYEPGEIPDGFYLVDDSEHPQPEFQQAVIAAVAKITHIAPADHDGKIIQSPMVAPGVINSAIGARAPALQPGRRKERFHRGCARTKCSHHDRRDT